MLEVPQQLAGVSQRDVDGRRRPADRVRVRDRPRVGEERGQRRGLGQPEPVAHPRLREALLDQPYQRRRHRRSAVGRTLNAGEIEVGEPGMVQRMPVDGRRGGHHADPLLRYRAQEPVHLERRHDNRRRADLHHRDQLAVARGDVEQRYRHQVAQRRIVPGQFADA